MRIGGKKVKLAVRECVLDDLITLREISCNTFSDTFGRLNTPSNMKAYIEQAFDVGNLREQLLNSNSFFYFLYADETLSGYLKINEHQAQTDIHDSRSLEIERIYVTKDFQGKGLGSVLMDKAVEIADIRGKSYIWLGVWEKNDRAFLFYKKNGFYVVGKHSFIMGKEEQTDYIMRKDIGIVNHG